jgi:hypothetical protein
MITEYEVKIIEGEKSVKQEIKVRGDSKDEAVNEVRDIYLKLKPFCQIETVGKSGVR